MEKRTKRKMSDTEINEIDDSDDEIIEINDDIKESSKTKVECPHGSKCYRKNPSHLKEYSHAVEKIETLLSETESSSVQQSSKRTRMSTNEPKTLFNFYLTKVNNVRNSSQINSTYSLGIEGDNFFLNQRSSKFKFRFMQY